MQHSDSYKILSKLKTFVLLIVGLLLTTLFFPLEISAQQEFSGKKQSFASTTFKQVSIQGKIYKLDYVGIAADAIGEWEIDLNPPASNPFSMPLAGLTAQNAFGDFTFRCQNNFEFSGQIAGYILIINDTDLLRQLLPEAEFGFVLAAIPSLFPWPFSWTQFDKCSTQQPLLLNDDLLLIAGAPSSFKDITGKIPELESLFIMDYLVVSVEGPSPQILFGPDILSVDPLE